MLNEINSIWNYIYSMITYFINRFLFTQHIFIIIYAIFLENGNQIHTYTKEKHWHQIQKLLAVVILGWGRNDFGI